MHFPLFECLVFVPSLVLAASLNEWRSRSIYQVITDRFATSDGTSPACATGERKYCGGTWKGVTRNLDYIQNMGFDAVWISPVVSNVEGRAFYGEAYHGYWTNDLHALNSRFGSADDLKELSKALHDRGMYLMVDVVVNHMGPNISAAANFSSDQAFSSYKPFSDASSYHPFNLITPSSYAFDTANQTDIEASWIGDGPSPLPDINTENTTIVRTLNEWVGDLVSNYSIDGLRIDTVKHIRRDFWPDFRSAAGVFTMGEVLHDHVEYVANYTHVLDSVLDYPTYFSLFSAFTTGPGAGNLSDVAAKIVDSQRAYEHGTSAVGSFVENHDQPRLLSKTQDASLVMNAITWPFIHDGMPILYYGQEQSFNGGNDPDNREALWTSGYKTDGSLVKHVKTLNAVRKVAISAKQNFLTTPMSFPPQPNDSTTSLVACKPPLVALITNIGSTGSATWTLPKKTFKSGTHVIDVLTCTEINTANTNADGNIVVTSNNGMPQMLISADLLKSQPKTANQICSDALNNFDSTSSARRLVSDGLVIFSAMFLATLFTAF